MARVRSITNIRQDDRPSKLRRLLFPLVVLAAGVTTYYNSFAGVFLFDDRLHILGHRRLTALWPLGEALARRRPVVDYSLALNYTLFGERVWGYHAVNVAVHVLAALTLYGIVRRTLRRRRPALGISGDNSVSPPDRSESSAGASTDDGSASWIALAAATIWVVHPLQTQSVTYVIQRAESLMGLFYLLTLYCVIRGAASSESRAARAGAAGWYAAAVVGCALGMGSKAVMVTAPIMVLVYDRVFLAGSFARALRRRWGLYAGLAVTWGVMWSTGVVQGVLNPSARSAHIGLGYKGITPIEYALTQFGVLVHYLSLSLWPRPLCLDYTWPVARTIGSIAAPAVLIVMAIAATAWGLVRRPRLAFLGVWFFLILAPTSSMMPIKDTMFEHRMYLPLAAVVVLFVTCAWQATQQLVVRAQKREDRLRVPTRESLLAAPVVAVVVFLAAGAIRRNRAYHNEVGMWRDVLAKRPSSARAAENLGTALLGEGELKEALTILRKAVKTAPRSATARNALGFALVGRGELDEASASFREALRLDPNFARAHLNLGNAMLDTGRIHEATDHFAAAVRIRPAYSEARLNLGNALLRQGRLDEALREYQEILRVEPRNASAWSNMGFVLLSKQPGDRSSLDEAVRALRTALEINPSAHNARNSLGIALATQGKLDEAVAAFRQVLSLRPNFSGAHYNLAGCLLKQGDTHGAIRHYEKALELRPAEPSTHFELGQALVAAGNLAAAIEHFKATLRIKPDHTAARRALEAAQARLGRSPNPA